MSDHVSAIILAAGFSSRMGAFKPLLPLKESTALEVVIGLFQAAGIGTIHVVTGHRSGELEPLVAQSGARMVHNPRYQEGMFTSVVAGVSALEDDCTGFFVLPVDVPLVRPATIERMLKASVNCTADVIYPMFQGDRGHPPLIAGRHAAEIISWKGEGGLRGALSRFDDTSLEVEVADELILQDMDTPDDYQRLRVRGERLHVPSEMECQALLENVLSVDRKIVQHGIAVANVAAALGAELNRAGCELDLPLLRAAGLLHDLARHEPDHAKVGAELLGKMGCQTIGTLVASHMDLDFDKNKDVDASAVLYLADKLVQGNRLVSLKERFRAALERHSGQPEIIGKVYSRLITAMDIQNKLEQVVGHTLTEILPTHVSTTFSHAG